MVGFILGEKSEQSQTFTQEGERIPTTLIKTTPCYLVDIKWPKKHGYFSVMLGFGQARNIKKPSMGQLAKAGIKTPLRFFREFRLDKLQNKIKFVEEGKKSLVIGEKKIHIGEELKPSAFFKKGELVDVSGTSKGKGFQGVVKRHGFAGGPRTHGQSDRERAPGAIGQTTTPGRVFKGKRMAGRMGNKKVMVKKLQVVDVKEDGLVIKGVVPGARGGLLKVMKHE
ncbi:50S ribosomal protein L3 [Candidatus Roizmanbacteria bacterium]|nr:50S ribosomal protein L3 [Candidatus Roizmanbacteria bacterium]